MGGEMESEKSRKQSLSNTKTVKQLRKTVTQLEGIIQELNNITVEQLPESPSLETLIQTTEELEDMISQAKQVSSPTTTPEKKVESERIQLPQKESFSSKIKTSAIKTVTNISQSTKYQFKKWLILGITAAIAMVLIQIGLQFLPNTSLAMAEVTSTQVVTEQPTTKKELDLTSQTDLKIAPETVESKKLEATETLIPEEIIITEPASEAATEIEIITPEVKSPEKITPKIKPVKTLEKPRIQFTPEQNFIAAIENKVAKISSSYEPELLTTIEADFNSNKLLITVNEQWYEFSSDRQDKISNEILKRSRKLAFDKVIIQNTKGELLARSPVVGNNMVIFKRIDKN